MKTAHYTKLDGTPLEVPYDETSPCIICDLPVIAASTAGTDICPWCDCGNYRDGTKWTLQDAILHCKDATEGLIKEFKRRAREHQPKPLS